MKHSRIRSTIQVLGLALLLLPFIQPDAQAWEKDGLRLRGRMQVRWNVEHEIVLEPGPTGPEETWVLRESDWVDYLSLRRVRFDGRWEPDHWIRLMIEFELAEGDLEPRDLYARLKLHDLLRIQAGQFKKPFSRLKMTSPYDLVIPERGLLDRFVVSDGYYGGYGGRDIGLMLSGVWDGPVRLRYYLGAFNNPLTDNRYHRDYVARLQVRILKGLILAASASHKLYDQEFSDPGDMDYRVVKRTGNLFGIDLRWTMGPIRMQLECAFGDNPGSDPDDPTAVADGQGHSLFGLHHIVSYYLEVNDWLALEPAFMVEFFDPGGQKENLTVRLAGALNADFGEWIRVVFSAESLLWESPRYDTPTTLFVQLGLRL